MECSGARESELMLERQVGSTLSARRRRPRASPTVIPPTGPSSESAPDRPGTHGRVDGRPVHPSRRASSLPPPPDAPQPRPRDQVHSRQPTPKGAPSHERDNASAGTTGSDRVAIRNDAI